MSLLEFPWLLQSQPVQWGGGGHIPPGGLSSHLLWSFYNFSLKTSAGRQWKWCVATVEQQQHQQDQLWAVGGWAQSWTGSIAPLGLFSGCPWPWPAPATLCFSGTISLSSVVQWFSLPHHAGWQRSGFEESSSSGLLSAVVVVVVLSGQSCRWHKSY